MHKGREPTLFKRVGREADTLPLASKVFQIVPRNPFRPTQSIAQLGDRSLREN